MALRVVGRSAEEPVNMLTILWIGARARVADEADPRLVADVRALRSALRRDSLGRSDDRRTPQDTAMAVTGPLDRTNPAGRRPGGPRVVLRPLRAGRSWTGALQGARPGRGCPRAAARGLPRVPRRRPRRHLPSTPPIDGSYGPWPHPVRRSGSASRSATPARIPGGRPARSGRSVAVRPRPSPCG